MYDLFLFGLFLVALCVSLEVFGLRVLIDFSVLFALFVRFV